MHAATPSHAQGDSAIIEGLAQGHAYSLLDVYSVANEEDEEIRLVKLRNPWGKTEWEGNWNDSSNLWTEEMKNQVAFEAKDDGVFYMCEEDFLVKFEWTTLILNRKLDKSPLVK